MAVASFQTATDVQEASAEWVISNLSFVRAGCDKGQSIDSDPILHVGNWTFCLRLFANGLEESKDGFGGFAIQRCDKDKPETLLCKYRIFLKHKDSSGETLLHTHGAQVRSFGRASNWGTPNSFPIKWLEDEVHGFNVGDTITIHAWVQVSSGTGGARTAAPCLSNTLATNLEEVLTSGYLADMSMDCGSESLPCHSFILMARSPVFKQMLQADMAESKSRKVHVTDIEPTAMKNLLHFLYTDKLKVDTDSDDEGICQLFQAAHKYEVKPLADYCAALLQRKLSSRNAVTRLSLADLYDCVSLRQSCLEFITSTPAILREVQDTAEFDHLCETRPKLLKEMLAMSTGGRAKSSKRPSSSSSLEFPNGTDWSRLTLSSLKKACQERGLSESGTKASLKDRLETHEG